jgi:DNA invertase Pin-like site-specific DNA recombinase
MGFPDAPLHRVPLPFFDLFGIRSVRQMKRPQFQAMLAAASRREFDLVLFWSLDRFSREGVLPTLKHLEVLTSYDVIWKSFTEQYFDFFGIFRDAVISIAATLAKQERLKISEHTVAGLERARKQGRVGGRPKLVLDREQARRLRSEGKSLRERSDTMGLSLTTTAREDRLK